MKINLSPVLHEVLFPSQVIMERKLLSFFKSFSVRWKSLPPPMQQSEIHATTEAVVSKMSMDDEEATVYSRSSDIRGTEGKPTSQPKNRFSTRLKVGLGVGIMLTVVTLAILLTVYLGKSQYDMGVASDNPVCTNIGADILRKGGGAVDATIAVLLCLGAVQPQSNGIGGGGFMLVRTKSGSSVINFRETAPAAATQNMYASGASSTVGGLASGIPGEIAGHWHAHQLHGRLTWAELFQPTIAILRTGINVTNHMEKSLKSKKDRIMKEGNNMIKSLFFKNISDPGSYLREGETFTNPKLAAAYELIAEQGRDGFYKGKIAQNIVSATNATGGILTLEDLENYQVDVVDPIESEYRGYKVLTAPPPASGHVISLVLQLLDNFDISTPNTTAWNYILEAIRFGYAARSQTGDMAYSNKTAAILEEIINGSWSEDILNTHFRESANGVLTPYNDINKYLDRGQLYYNYDGSHTTHVSVLGPDGEAVSCTSTVNLYFGSLIMTDDGIVMNDEMDDFSTPGRVNAFGYQPSPENYIKPGKRPLSSSSLSIFQDNKGQVRFVTGAAGGSRIITGTLLSIINAIDWKMTLADNMAAPRLHDQLNQVTLFEDGNYDSDLVEELRSIGYNMTGRSSNSPINTVSSVSCLGSKTEAEGDWRKGGSGTVVT